MVKIMQGYQNAVMLTCVKCLLKGADIMTFEDVIIAHGFEIIGNKSIFKKEVTEKQVMEYTCILEKLKQKEAVAESRVKFRPTFGNASV